jgi:putative flippase GtrA
MKAREQPPLMVALKRAQLASLTATLVDFGTVIFLVEIARFWYVAATATGALVGAAVNFILGRHWSFMAGRDPIRGQIIRYALVSVASLALNSFGVYLLTDGLNVHYAISRVIAAFVVAIMFNFPLQRRFVFAMQKYA